MPAIDRPLSLPLSLSLSLSLWLQIRLLLEAKVILVSACFAQSPAAELPPQVDDFAFQIMDFVLEMDFALNMMNSGRWRRINRTVMALPRATLMTAVPAAAVAVMVAAAVMAAVMVGACTSGSGEFRTKNNELWIINDVFCIKNDWSGCTPARSTIWQ